MSQKGDVKSSHQTSTGAATPYTFYAGRTRLKGFILLSSATGGMITVYDNASALSGDVVIQIDTPANANNVVSLLIPEDGILAQNGLTASIPSGVGVTLIYG